MNIKSVLEEANKEFINAKIDNYFYETRELLAFSLGKTKEWIMINFDYELQDDEYKKFLDFKERRIQGEPFQYILGEQYFMGLKFLVNENVLIPRADTEILVYEVINLMKARGIIKILDMCTGSGCIAVSLAKNLKNSTVFGVDISKDAISIAEKNSKLNETNVKFFQSNLFSELKNEKFDVIVSNPPYIESAEIKFLNDDVLREPVLALDGGEDGLKFYRDISVEAIKYLNDDGVLAFEIGYNQAKAVYSILNELRYKEIKVIKDYSDNDRVVIARK